MKAVVFLGMCLQAIRSLIKCVSREWHRIIEEVIKMEKNKVFRIFLSAFFILSSVHSAPWEDYTLTVYTNLFFQNRVEYTSGIKPRNGEEYPSSAIDLNDFKDVLHAFVDGQKKVLGSQSGCFYAQKVSVQARDKLYITGDIHASAHSFYRNLRRWLSMGVLNDNFELTKTKSGGSRYLFFTGDIADRGRYGVEVWFLLLILKLKNWDNVFICRGNHESDEMASKPDGLFSEILEKCFQEDSIDTERFKSIIRLTNTTFTLLPSVVYVGNGNDFIQVSHGTMPFEEVHTIYDLWGFYSFNVGCYRSVKLMGSLKSFLEGEKRFKKLDEKTAQYLFWGDFSSEESCGNESSRGTGLLKISPEKVRWQLHEKGIPIRNIFRGHRHNDHAVSMQPDRTRKKIDEGFWIKHRETIHVRDHLVYTFMSSPEGVGRTNVDGFGVLEIKEKYDEWMLTAYEYPLK